VMPGIIEAQTTIGLRERFEPSDANELTDPCTPQLKVIDALNPFSKEIKEVVFGGITTALITPGRLNVIGGQPAVVKLTGTWSQRGSKSLWERVPSRLTAPSGGSLPPGWAAPIWCASH